VRVAWIEARDFRNHREVSLELSPDVTAVVGPNGRGKTNLLEAIYYLCWLVSPRVSSDLPLVRSGAACAYLRGEVLTDGGRFLVEVEVRAGGQNRVQVNRSAVRRKRDLRRDVRAVFGGPDDLAVVTGDPGERRRFMDEVVAGLWPAKEGTTAGYERVLRQRNRLLKEWGGPGEPPELQAWDGELVNHGVVLTQIRRQAVDRVADRAGEGFRQLSGRGEEALVVEYRPSVGTASGMAGPPGAEAVAEAFRARLADRRGDELVRRTSLVGPHRDDVGLTVEGLAARGFASHGEAWGAAVCLRLAQGQAVAEEMGEDPVLLLDDPFSGLDPDRRRRLADGLQGRGQVLLAVPEETHIPPGAAVLCVEEGNVVPR
jgi:DNA replication and repair protein RecF